MDNSNNHSPGMPSSPSEIALSLFALLMLSVAAATVAYGVNQLRVPTSIPAAEQPGEPVARDVDLVSGGPFDNQEDPALKAAAIPTVNGSAKPTTLCSSPKSSHEFFREPDVGQIYFQVAASHRGVASVLAMYLEGKGLQMTVAVGPDERSYRVLAGPLVTETEIEQTRTVLTNLDLTPFLRRINETH